MTLFAKRVLCYVLGAILLAGAGMYLLFGDNPGVGIFLVLVAAIINRVLILNLAESRYRDETSKRPDELSE